MASLGGFGNFVMSPIGYLLNQVSGGGNQAPSGGMGGQSNYSPALNGISALRSMNQGQPQQPGGGGQGQLKGGFLRGLKNFAVGTPGSIEGIARFPDQDQMQALQWLLSNGLEGLQDPYQGFQGIEDYARHNFQNKTIPSLAERFSSMGQNSLSSPDFAYNNLQAGKDFDLGLAALRSQYGMQNRQQNLGQVGMGLTPRYENFSIPGQQGVLQPLLQTGAKAATNYFTGGMFS